MESAESLRMLEKVFTVIILSFVYIFAIAKFIGTENKEKWFKKRTRYTFFSRRGFLGNYIQFGRPVCKEGYIVALVMYGVILGLGYVYLFVY